MAHRDNSLRCGFWSLSGAIADSGQPNALKIYGFTALRTISKRTRAVLKRHAVSAARPMLSENARDPCLEPRGSAGPVLLTPIP